MDVENTYRAIDANINRISEGLRVLEDIARFCYNDSPVQQSLKELRHRFRSGLDQMKFIPFRDVLHDTGFSSKGEMEFSRDSIGDVLKSNVKRVEEGLRVLEELFKIESPDLAREMKGLRYAVYSIEKDMLSYGLRPVLRKGLYLIITDPPLPYENIAEMAVRSGLPAIQLRYKGTSDREFLDDALKIRRITKGTKTLFIVNDRPDIAFISKADGVHLGQDDISPVDARSFLGGDMLIGLSTHTLEQAKEASNMPVDYIGFGPVWETKTKPMHSTAMGIDNLKLCVELSDFPVVAIGGISKERLVDIGTISCNNIAVVSAVMDAGDPLKEMVELNKIFLEKA